MKTSRLYTTIGLVVLLSFLPVLYRLFSTPSIGTLLLISFIIAAAAGLLEYYRNVRPYLELSAKRNYLYGYACDDVLADLLVYDPSARLNVMEVDRGLRPGRGKFEIVYPLKMEGEPDEDLELRLDQGVCGQAANEGGFCVANLEVPHGPTFNLDAEQREKTRHLKLVLSMPIKKAKRGRGGVVVLQDKIIGVVNVDSKRNGALAYYETKKVNGRSLLEEQAEVLRKVSEQCSYIMS